MKRCLKIMAILLLAALLMAGCGTGKEAPPVEPEPEEPPPPEPAVIRTPVIGARLLEDGRMVGGTAKGKIGDEMINAFFSFTVNKAELVREYEGTAAERGYVFLVSELAIKNAFDGSLPMWSSDFLLQWGEEPGDYGYPMDKFAPSQMDDAFRLPEGWSVTKDAVFEVPVFEGSKEYVISYQEYYEDGTDGNTFYVIFDLSM